jgi:hypothetical protein
MPVVALEDTKAGLVGLVVVQAKQPLSHQVGQPGQPTLAVAEAAPLTTTLARLVLAEQVAQVS